MLVVSFIRHGESLDNLKSIWAGHKDAELTELGVQQARALGKAYATTRLDAIIASDLKRAHATGLALFQGQSDPKPSFQVDHNVREQHFGDGEGHSWDLPQFPNKSLDDYLRDGQYPVLFDRNQKFPNGESLNDLAARAKYAVDQLVLRPHLARAIGSGSQDVHVAVVSHGLCISEMIPALLERNDGGAPDKDYTGLMNTGWTRVMVQVKPGVETPQAIDGLNNLPPLVVTVTDVNRHEHIINLKRQNEVVEDDPNQRGMREFFGGGVKQLLEGKEERN